MPAPLPLKTKGVVEVSAPLAGLPAGPVSELSVAFTVSERFAVNGLLAARTGADVLRVYESLPPAAAPYVPVPVPGVKVAVPMDAGSGTGPVPLLLYVSPIPDAVSLNRPFTPVFL